MTTALKKPQRSARKPKGDGHMRRGEILEAAQRIFLAEGYQGATIRKIADEVGVSSTALYMHFPDKSCILLEICQGTIRQLLERNSEIADKPMDPASRVKLMLESYMRWGLDHPNAYELVFSNVRHISAVMVDEATTADLGSQCYEIFSGVVREIAAEGRLRTGTADSAAQALWASCHGVVALMINRPNFGWAPTDELIEVTLDGLMYGLVAD